MGRPMLFCLVFTTSYQLCHLQFNVVYFDEGTISGKFKDLQADLRLIEDQGNALELIPNVDKSELIFHNNLTVSTSLMSAFLCTTVCSFHPGKPAGLPLENEAMKCCLEEQLNQLKPARGRLCHLHLHDAISILRHSLSISKPLHILRTSPAFSSPLLESWDHLMMVIVSRITNIKV